MSAEGGQSTNLKRLNLGFEDEEDLKVVATLLQDAVVNASDITYLKGMRRFALLANRFCWEHAGPLPARARAGLHFNHVLKVRTKGIDRDAVEQALNLLTIDIETCAGENGVIINLVFAGAALIRLEAEVVEGGLKDLGDPWGTTRRPCHKLDEGTP